MGSLAILIAKYGYLILFPVAFFEGPIVTIAAGFFVSLGYINLLPAYFIIVVGDLAGDCVHYLIGYKGGEKFIAKWGKYLKIEASDVTPLENQFKKRGGVLLLTGKILHGIGGAFLVAAGIVKMSFRKFFIYNLAGTLIKSMALLLVGFYFGAALGAIDSFLSKLVVILTGSAIVLLIIYLLYFRKNGKNKT